MVTMALHMHTYIAVYNKKDSTITESAWQYNAYCKHLAWKKAGTWHTAYMQQGSVQGRAESEAANQGGPWVGVGGPMALQSLA